MKKNNDKTKYERENLKHHIAECLYDLVNDTKISKNLSNAEQAREIGIKDTTLSKTINSGTLPDSYTIYKLAQYYKYDNESITSDYILGLSKNKTASNTNISKETGLSDKAIGVLKNVENMKEKNPTLYYKQYALNYLIENMNNTEFLGHLYYYLFAIASFEYGNEELLARPIKYKLGHNEESMKRATTRILDQNDISDLYFSKIQQDIHSLKLLLEQQEVVNGKRSRKKE